MRLRRDTLVDLAALLADLGALGLALGLVERTLSRADSRRPLARAIRREATARDLVVITDETTSLAALVRPVPQLTGIPTLPDARGVERLYALAPTEAAMGPLFARFGPAAPFAGDKRARRWDLVRQHLARVNWSAAEQLGAGLQARREGGSSNGACTFDGTRLVCPGEDWLHVHVPTLRFEDVELRCVFAHPHQDGRLFVDLTGIPPSHTLVGVVGVTDTGYFPAAAPVTMRVEYRAEGAPVVTRDVVAPNRRGVTPYRIDVPHAPATATLTISATDTGARQFCFTLQATE